MPTPVSREIAVRASLPLLVACALLGGSGAAQAPPPLEEVRAREGQNLQEQAIASRDGFFTARVLGKVDPPEVGGASGVYSFEVHIGSDLPATCELIVTGFDLAGGLRTAANQTMQNLQSLYGRAQAIDVERIDAGVFGARPYMGLQWSFAMRRGDAIRLGALKQMAVTVDDHTLYCAHVDLGYTKSFQGAVGTLAASLQLRESIGRPSFTAISTATRGGEQVGVRVVNVGAGTDGATIVTSWTSLAERRPGEPPATRDERYAERSGKDGVLISAHQMVRVDGQVETELELIRGEGGAWMVRGQTGTTRVEMPVDAAPAPSSLVQTARARRALFTRKDPVGAEMTAGMWTTADPSRVVGSQTTVVAVGDAGTLTARETAGGRTRELVIDRATGLPLRVSEEGDASLQWERVHVSGSF